MHKVILTSRTYMIKNPTPKWLKLSSPTILKCSWCYITSILGMAALMGYNIYYQDQD